MKLINRTNNGQLHFCKCCDTYQLEFGNLFISLKKKDFASFQKYIAEVDEEKSIEANRNKPFNRKIFLSFPVKNVFFCLHSHELHELRELLFITKQVSKNDLETLLFTKIFIN